MDTQLITRDQLVGGQLPIVFRDATLESISADDVNVDDRIVTLSFSSEYPVERWGWVEVLGHQPEEIDFSRFAESAPYLEDHRWDKQRGVIEKYWIANGRAYADVRISQNPLGQQLLTDHRDGIKVNISVGYRIHEATLVEKKGDTEYYRITRWEPYEISSVSVPADPTVGVNRSDQQLHSLTIREVNTMEDDEIQEVTQTTTPEAPTQTRHEPAPAPAPAPVVSAVRTPAPATAQRTTIDTVATDSDAKRIAEVGQKYGAETLANDYVRTGRSFEEFNEALIGKLHAKRDDPTAESTMFDMDVPAKDLSRYSVINLFRGVASGNWKKAGLERELSQAIALRTGKDPEGAYISPEALGFGVRQQLERQMYLRQQAAGVSGKGAELVATELHSELFIEALRSQAQLGGLGARYMSGLVGDVDIPKQTGSATFYWVDEDGEATDSDLIFSIVQMKPHTVATAVQMTRRMMIQSTPDIEMLVRADIMRELTLALDAAGLKGTGLNNEPLGVVGTNGIGAVDLTGGIDWAKTVEFETDVAEANANADTMAYVMRPSMRGKLKTTLKAAGVPGFIWENGRVNDYQTAVTTQMDADTMLFGDFSQLMFGMWGALDVVPDTATKVKSGGLVMRMFQDVDVAVRHAQAFSYGA